MFYFFNFWFNAFCHSVQLTSVVVSLSKTVVALLQLCDFISTTMPVSNTVPSKMLEIVGFSNKSILTSY